MVGLAVAVEPPVVWHGLELRLDPAAGTLEVSDHLRVPVELRPRGELRFVLRAGWTPRVDGHPAEPVGSAERGVQEWRYTWPQGREGVTIGYRGAFEAPEGQVGWFSAGDAWVPTIPDSRVRFRMAVEAPAGWVVVSEGMPLGENGWCEDRPLEGIDLVWGRFLRYREGSGVPLRLAYLLEPDASLAQRYLGTAGGALDLYSRLIAPYPYAKFALVENDRQTGYGLPSFTLMGSRVLRLPFILDSAFVHEIVHNWWGNGVFVDWDSGNWSEGLTTYFADYAQEEAKGRGAAFRHAALQKYADYVQTHRDLPLAQFRSRHDELSHAVGYHKGMMVFHMLRRRLGDQRFLKGVRRFWSDYRGRRAGFGDLRAVMEVASGTDLRRFFEQWVDRPGAPRLQIVDAPQVSREGGRWELRLRLGQVQPGPAYRLEVPLAVSLQGEPRARMHVVRLSGREAVVTLRFAHEPVHVRVDPAFDVFRRLDPEERPPSLGAVWGAERIWVVLPRRAPAARRAAWEALAAQWLQRYPQMTLHWDDEALQPPPGVALWILGRENRLRSTWAPGLAARVAQRLGEQNLSAQSLAVAAAARHGATAVALLQVVQPEALPALARKLPHYGRYGIVAFEGDSARNVLKAQWPIASSSLSRALREGARAAPLPARRPLLALAKARPPVEARPDAPADRACPAAVADR